MTTAPNPLLTPSADHPAVLYVDDEEQALKYFARGLGREFAVLTANGADAALALLERHAGQVGVVISDQRMPGRTGVSLLAEVRQRWPAATRLLITAYTDLDSAVSAVNAGAISKYVHKPADFPVLKQLLTEAMAVHRETAHRDRMAATMAELAASQADRDQLHAELVALSREAGRAEVATGILHNVGNVLNSMTVSAGVLADTLRQSRVANLTKGLAMLEEHAADLATFLTADERGRRLPDYLSKLAGVLGDEQRQLSDTVASLTRNIEHVTAVVRSQQAHAKHVVVRDRVAVADLVADAVRVARPEADRHAVAVTVDCPPAEPVLLDRHRVLQILVNLVTNAVNAVAEGRADGRAVSVRVDSTADRVAVGVSDNGVGIAAENLAKLFTFGFTTRAQGHGFGLHSAANAAKEMGGALTVHSDGVGRGATFHLELPIAEQGGGVAPPLAVADPSVGGKARAA